MHEYEIYKRPHSATAKTRPSWTVNSMRVKVERRIGGKWWTMKFLGQSDSNIDHLSGKGYVVHEYIHVATDEFLIVGNCKIS